MVSAKGKEKVANGGGKGKRKWSSGGGDDKTGMLKRKNHSVVQFFDDVAYQVDKDEYSSNDSLFNIDDFLEDELSTELILSRETEEVPPLPLLLNGEEMMSEEELERILEERYKPGARFFTYAEDGNYEHKTSIETDVDYVPSANDPKIWKVKCMIGRERYSVFCLTQKYVDMEYLGTKLQIVSAFAPDHAKGFIVIEAEKQNDICQACKGLSTIYSSRVTLVPNNEISRLLSVRSKSTAISEGTWARVKNGKYKGDLALVLAVNDARKKVTAKLVPRIDLKVLAEKYGGGVAAKRTAIPRQRLISSSELDEFRPLIHSRKDRDTKEMVEVLDGMMLKDGYLYKKISIDSLSFWGIMPTEDELFKFEPSNKDEFTDAQWLSDLYGEKPETQVAIFEPDKGSGNIFEMHDLVFFGKYFGVVISSEKDDDTVKVMKESSEGPSVVTVKKSELKIAFFDKKLFSVLDHNSRTISINDSVRVLDGPLKDRQGVVKNIYRGILFLFDEREEENNGYICTRAQLCEKVNISGDTSNEKGSEPGSSEFADLPSSPTPLLNKSNFKHEDNEIFSVGQSLRIRVGPLKGYLCRVLAIRRSDVIVKLNSQQKIITVKIEHLSEVRGRDSTISQGEEYGSIKRFDVPGTRDGASDSCNWKINTTSDQISSWGAESLWNKSSAGFSFWGKQKPVVNAEIRPKDWKDENNSISEKSSKGFGGWKKGGMVNRSDDTFQEESWGRSKSFEGGHRGSGGRRGRGGGRGQYGGGRSFDKIPSTNWNKEGHSYGSNESYRGSQKDSESNSSGWNHNRKYEQGGAWKNEKKVNRGSSTGWGQSNWQKSVTIDAGGTTWSSKSNWNGDQDDTFSDRGKVGGRRGGSGGRGSNRGGFRGRGCFDSGGFGGGRGGSNRGVYGGRGGGSEREGGFRGKGGFRGRGRGKGGW